MLGRIAVLVLCSAFALPQTPPAPTISNDKFIRWPLAEQVQAVSLMDQKTFLIADVAGLSVQEWKGVVPQRPSGEGLQVWVLRKDGQAVRQRTPARPSEWGGLGGIATKSWEFTFDYAPFRDLAAVVVAVEGQSFVREMPKPKAK